MTTEREATAHLRDVREPGGRTRRRFVSVLLGAALVLTACGGGDDGTEISSAIDGVVGSGARTTASAVGLASGDGDVVWKATSTPAQVADSISLAGRPDERTDGTDGAVFMLYKAGTVWLTPIAAGGTAVVLYRSNDTAYGRHNRSLLAHTGWGSTVNRYRSGGGSTSGGNNFRSGGSSSGK